MIEGVDKLRGWADVRWEPWAESRERLHKMLDEIEREIAERYMELPMDADGVPIRVGDELETANGGKVIVKYVGECEVRVYRDGEQYRVSQDEYVYTCRHVKPRTLEDVLLELGDRVCNSGHQWGLDAADVVPKYAAEIRELLGGDAE